MVKAGARLVARTTSDCYDSEFPCNAGSTPLHVAALRDHKDFVALLLGSYVKMCQANEWQGEDPRKLEDAYGRWASSTLRCLLVPQTTLVQSLEFRKNVYSNNGY